MQESALMERKELRDQAIGRLEVLDRVKNLFLVPELTMATTDHVAAFYEVEPKVIQTVYLRHKDEMEQDGVIVVKPSSFKCRHAVGTYEIQQIRAMTHYVTQDGNTFSLNGNGTRCYSKRAVLRIGMLLRDSPIAKEVRTQLLNTFENATPQARIADIEQEQKIQLELGAALMSKDTNRIGMAFAEAFAFQNRHIEKLQQSNALLTAETLQWTDRASINQAVRRLAGKSHLFVGAIWNELYDELRYKHGIGLSQRGSSPYIQHVKPKEWPLVQQSFAAICEQRGFSAESICG